MTTHDTPEAALAAATLLDLVTLIRVGFLVYVAGERATAGDVGNLTPLLHLILGAKDSEAALAALPPGWCGHEPEPLKEALRREIGRQLTDARVEELMRAQAIPLHGRGISVDLQARGVAASLRALVAYDIVDAALAPSEP